MSEPLLYIVDRGAGWVTQDGPPDDGRVIGIQTRIAEHLCTHGGISSPFHQPAPSAVRCGVWDRHMNAGRCILDHGHAGCHVFDGQETRDHSAKLSS